MYVFILVLITQTTGFLDRTVTVNVKGAYKDAEACLVELSKIKVPDDGLADCKMVRLYE